MRTTAQALRNRRGPEGKEEEEDGGDEGTCHSTFLQAPSFVPSVPSLSHRPTKHILHI